MARLLLQTLALPFLAALLMPIVARLGDRAVRAWTLLVTLVTLTLTVSLCRGYLQESPGTDGFAVSDVAWLSSHATEMPLVADGATGPGTAIWDIRFHVGLDGLGLWLFALAPVLMLTSILVSWEAIQDRPAWFYGMLLLLQGGCLGVFAARDLILFYVFFEFTLLPLFFLIGIWGSEQREYAATKFFLYTLAGSLFTFLGLLAIVLWHYQQVGVLTFSIPALTAGLTEHPIAPFGLQLAIFLALFAGFAIKVPLFPLHTWLPLAHVQAPTAGSIFLAGVLLKIGTYGFLRFSVPMLPDATAACAPALLWLSVIGILYGALVALAQTDIKRLIAYSSVSHLGFCMLGLFALNRIGSSGSVLQMVNHGISTGALFALVGMLYERYHTREISAWGGLARRLPVLSCFMFLFTFSSIGLPLLNGFAGELLVLVGMFQRAWQGQLAEPFTQLKWIAVLSVVGVVLGAWYMLWLVQRVFFGPLREPHGIHGVPVRDLNWREIAALVPLAVLAFWIGIYPQLFLRPIQPAVDALTHEAQGRWEAVDRPPLADRQAFLLRRSR